MVLFYNQVLKFYDLSQLLFFIITLLNIVNHFRLAKVDIQTQTAYDLASKGLIRAGSNKEPLIYGIKCISLELPNFIIG